MVAKENRFVLVKNDDADGGPGMVADNMFTNDRMNYHKAFLKTQAIASKFAKKFNQSLNACLNHFDASSHEFLRRLPRIQFLKPFVTEIVKADGEEWNVLVEEQLMGRCTNAVHQIQ